MGNGVLKDKIAIVTGSARGIGKGIVLKFAGEGAKVVVNYNTSEIDANETILEIKKSGGKAVAVKANVSKAKEVDQLVKSTIEIFGGVDILVNNAAIFVNKVFLETTEEDYDSVMNSNVRSNFLCSKRVVPVMIERGKGKIINISSISALASDPRESIYAASKGAIISLTRALAQELGPMNISVNAIAPGTIQTPMTDFLMKDTKLRDAIAMQTPIRRIGRPEDIGEAALFFAKDGTEFTTGNVLCVDGGWMIDSHIPWT